MSLLLPVLANAGSGGGRVPDPLQALRDRALAVARPAFSAWIGSLAPERMPAFGFPSPEEARRADLLPAIPLYRPRRSPDALTRREIEALLDSPPDTWLVPVEVGEHIVALVTVDVGPGRPPEAIEFGKPWAASRLDAGVRLLKERGAPRWEDLRFLGFHSPNVDLLLLRSGRNWEWLELGGTTAGEALRMSPARIEELLAKIRDQPVQEVP